MRRSSPTTPASRIFQDGPTTKFEIWTYGPKSPPTDAEIAAFDYFAFAVANPGELPPKVADVPAKELVHSFTGKDGHTVLIYRQARPATRG